MLHARGIYRCSQKVAGHSAYYARTSTGELLPEGLSVVWAGMRDADVVTTLATRLDAEDALPRNLYLMPTIRPEGFAATLVWGVASEDLQRLPRPERLRTPA